MSLADLAAIGSFVSGVAVLASLIFVGFQLRQNTQAVRAAASQSHTQNWQQITRAVTESADFARIWRLGLDDIECLTEDARRAEGPLGPRYSVKDIHSAGLDCRRVPLDVFDGVIGHYVAQTRAK